MSLFLPYTSQNSARCHKQWGVAVLPELALLSDLEQTIDLAGEVVFI